VAEWVTPAVSYAVVAPRAWQGHAGYEDAAEETALLDGLMPVDRAGF
jgi:hypothetical protein